MANPEELLQGGDALVVVDVQRDFCPGGALAITQGDQVVPVLNRWIHAGVAAGTPIYFSRDWHPRRHPSFVEFGGPWPVHCVQDTEGARFHPDLVVPESAAIVTKGVRFDRDQHSAFDDTGLASELRRQNVTRVWVGGLAQDVCVRATVLDAQREGLATKVIADATLPVTSEGRDKANAEMRRAGAEFVTTG